MNIRKIYTKKLGVTVAKSAQSASPGRYHVISGESSKWSVVSEGSTRALRAFTSKDQAVDFATESASKRTGEVIIHAASGQIADTISFVKK